MEGKFLAACDAWKVSFFSRYMFHLKVLKGVDQDMFHLKVLKGVEQEKQVS